MSKLSVDCRNKIYRYLLTNPDLGEPIAVHKAIWSEKGVKFDLHPSILRTYKIIEKEGAHILYNENQFIVVCSERPSWNIPLSPVTRYRGARLGPKPLHDLLEFPGSSKVQRWKVIICLHRYSKDHLYPKAFGVFCRALIKSPPRSLDIRVLPKAILHHEASPINYFSVENAFGPIKMVRNIQSVSFADANHLDVPDWLQSRVRHRESYESHFGHTAIQADVKLIAEGDEPVDYAFSMLPNLIAYAQTFERFLPFKKNMEFLPQVGFDYGAYELQYSEYQEAEYRNPFTGGDNSCMHPVEWALRTAINHENSTDVFKLHRAVVVEYLEKQFQEVYEMATDIHQFINEEKHSNGLLHADRVPEKEEFWRALLHFERYAKSFQRHVPPETAFEIRKQGKHFTNLYEGMRREQAMDHMQQDLDTYNFDRFMSSFKVAVDDMDEQFTEIRKARSELFKFDVLPTACNVDVEKFGWPYGDKVDWEEDEV